jgi:hypothetical protein
MKSIAYLAAALLAAGIPAAAGAQEATATAAATAPAVGATIFGPDGTEVGKVVSAAGGNVVIDTGTQKATVAIASIGTSDKGPAIGFTRAQLEAAVTAAAKEAAAKFEASLVAGAPVKTKDGVAVGTIKEVNADGLVVVQRTEGKPVALPKDTMMLDASGALALLFTAAEFEKAVGQSAGTPAPAAATTG